MRDLPSSRLFRALICLLVICCLVINISPIKAKAVVVESLLAAFGDDAILGFTFIVYCLWSGAVWQDLDIKTVEDVGQELRQYVANNMEFPDSSDSDDDDTPKTEDEWKAAISNGLDDAAKLVKEQLGSARWDGTDQFIWNLGKYALMGVLNFLDYCIEQGYIELPGEEAPEGFMYYNGVLLPELSEEILAYPYLYMYSSGSKYLIRASYAPYLRSSSGVFGCSEKGVSIATYYTYDTYSYWKLDSTGTSTTVASGGSSVFWSNVDYYYNESAGGGLYLSASEPLTQEEAYLEAVAILGETAQGIQNGTITTDDVQLPEYINVSEFFANISDADGIMQNYNNIAQELQDGTRDYNEFAQSVVASDTSTGDSSTGENTGTDTGTDTGGDTGGTTSGPVSDITPYGLELTEYFPFCIPFDIYDFFSAMIAEPEAPVFRWVLQDPAGNFYEIVVDLSPWDPLATLFRRMQLLLFIVGLAAASRKFIKW